MTGTGGGDRDLLVADDARAKGVQGGLYGRVVRFLRLGLIFGILAIVVTIFLWPELDDTVPTAPQKAAPDIASNELVKPRFEAVDPEQQPYTITADRAVQNTQDPDLIELTKPVADMTLHDGTWVALEADQGVFRQEKQIIDLTGHVRLFHDQGYEMKTAHAAISLKNQSVISTDPVSGQGPMGQIEAAGVDGDGVRGVLVFHGPAKLTLNQSLFE